MGLYRYRLTPADRKPNLYFLEINHSHGLFTTAAKNCSQGVSFKRDGEKAPSMRSPRNISSSPYIPQSPCLPPQGHWPPPAASCCGWISKQGCWKAWFIAIRCFIQSCWKAPPGKQITADDISDAALLKATFKAIIDLLYSQTEGIDSDTIQKAKNALKKIMLPFINSRVQ